jgi:site-specific DNA-methyltransferase (adenine-specific)
MPYLKIRREWEDVTPYRESKTFFYNTDIAEAHAAAEAEPRGAKGWTEDTEGAVDLNDVSLHVGDALSVLALIPPQSVDAVVTDAPYELGFMDKSWDASGIAFSVPLWQAVFRVLKPGGHLLAFGHPRLHHRTTCAIEDAGFDIRDELDWVYGQGFPKSHNLAVAFDKAEGMAHRGARFSTAGKMPGMTGTAGLHGAHIATSELGKKWQGWGTGLKPSREPIVLARKPLDGTVIENVQEHQTGAMNIDGTRIGERWPANTLTDAQSSHVLDRQHPGSSAYMSQIAKPSAVEHGDATAQHERDRWQWATMGSGVFYVPKPSSKEKNAGLGDDFDAVDPDSRTAVGRGAHKGVAPQKNHHPTVKPVALMRHLVRLITPPGGVVLDPFMGSGTTGIAAVLEGMRFFGIDLSDEYKAIAQARIAYWRESRNPDSWVNAEAALW